jgi:putative Holliday junction resolvase
MIDKTFICFDYGEKRIGIAVGQTLTATATPLGIIPVKHGKPDWSAITRIMEQWQPDAMVVGIPLQMDGMRQSLTVITEKFSRQLECRYALPVYQADERLTTSEARRRTKRNHDLDAVAAQVILESWLEELGRNDPAACRMAGN